MSRLQPVNNKGRAVLASKTNKPQAQSSCSHRKLVCACVRVHCQVLMDFFNQ